MRRRSLKFLTHDKAEAFGGQLAYHRIQRALIAALPGLAEAISADDDRPLLQMQRPGGGTLIVARASDENAGNWAIGIPMRPASTMYDADTWGEAVDIVVKARRGTGDDAAIDEADNTRAG